MLKSLKLITVFAALALAGSGHALAQDAGAGEKVFKKCKACHAVGEGAKNKVGPHLNELFGRKAAAIEGYKYSKAFKAAGEDGLVWNEETLDKFLLKPKAMIKKTKMSFGGLKKDEDRANIIAYLQAFSSGGQEGEPASDTQEQSSSSDSGETQEGAVADPTPKPLAKDVAVPEHGTFHLGRKALPEEVAAWDIDIRPDGKGLPAGKGTVAQGEPIYAEQCAICHGDFGEGIDRWPVLAGGFDTLTEERPEKTVGSYWPYLSTVFDYVRRAMPFGNARSLSDDDVYALTAYLLYLNDIVTEEDFELSKENFAEIQMPNEENFIPDDRMSEPHYADKSEPCMKDCVPGKATIRMRARVLDVTPDNEDDGRGSGIE